MGQLRRRAKRAVAGAPLPYVQVTQRPLQNLAFLSPLIVLYEAGMAVLRPPEWGAGEADLAASQILDLLTSLLGVSGFYVPGLAVVGVLLVWHLRTREPWRVDLPAAALMTGESMLWAVPLFALNSLVALRALADAAAPRAVVEDLVLGIGAGIYEELIFRMAVILAVTVVAADVARLPKVWASAVAGIVSAVLFAAHHYAPIGTDAFVWNEFLFRFAAGGYLACLFVWRGFGIAVGAHVFYNLTVALHA